MQAETDVLCDGQVGKKGVILKDHADAALVGGNVADVLAVELDLACLGLLEARDDA